MEEVCLRGAGLHFFFPDQCVCSQNGLVVWAHAEGNKVPLQELEQLGERPGLCAREWQPARQDTSRDDPIARFLCDVLLMHFMLTAGAARLTAHNGLNGSLTDIIAKEYNEKKTAADLCYYVRIKAIHPLLLINAQLVRPFRSGKGFSVIPA